MTVQPYVVAVTVYKVDNTIAANRSIQCLNEATGETMVRTTNGAGQVVFDLANFESGWENGHYIQITSLDGGETAGDVLKIKVEARYDSGDIIAVDAAYEKTNT